MTMTHKERLLATLNREPVDELARYDSLWPETKERYIAEGKMQEGEYAPEHFDMSFHVAGFLNGKADLDFGEQIIEETEETKLILDGNGAQLRFWKHKSGTPEHVDFTVQDRAGWEEKIKPHLLNVDRRRIPFESYRDARRVAAENNRAFLWEGVAPFEQMHPVCGHEYMLMGMALDPDWITDMVDTFANLTIMHQEVLFEEEGKPDAIWYYEDMGFKEKPFMSPTMYKELVQPGHAKLIDHAHSNNLKVIMHSCGFVEPLLPGMVEAGIDCLQAMEVKAGMDMPRIAKEFGDRISFCGNIDIREIASNDFARIDAELEKKVLPVLEMGGHYILHSDHSIPPNVEHDTLEYFMAQSSKLSR